MRHLVAGACSLALLTACGGTVTGDSTGARFESNRASSTAGVETTRCESSEGFRVDRPSDWSVNPGDVLPPCSWFAADSFTVPEASDVRIADVTLTVEVGLDRTTRWPDEAARSSVEVAGRPAVRIEQLTGPGFYPAGTPITTYVVDLGPGRHEGAVLVADTVGLPGFDHDRNVEVLDAMMASLSLGAAGRV
jgi:hypothetical protein